MSADDYTPGERAHIDDAIMAACAEAVTAMNEGRPGRVVTRYALVVEYAHPEGGKGIARISGPEGTMSWEAAGLWHEALYGDWSD